MIDDEWFGNRESCLNTGTIGCKGTEIILCTDCLFEILAIQDTSFLMRCIYDLPSAKTDDLLKAILAKKHVVKRE